MELVPKIEFLMEGMNSMVRKNKAQEETASASEIISDSIWEEKKSDNDSDGEDNNETMPKMLTLSERTKLEDNDSETEEKSEKQLIKETNQVKREMRKRLKNTDDKFWQYENVSVVLRDNKPYKYILSLSSMQLAEGYLAGQLIYDPQVQRGSKMTKSKGEVPIIDLKHCRLIESAMCDGSIHGGSLSLNFPTEYNEELIYDSENMTLSGNGPLVINDGMHRIFSSVSWRKRYLKNPNECKSPESFYFPVNIENISKLASEDLFREYAVMGKTISKNRVSVHNVFDKNYEIAQRVMKESQLRGKVEMISNSIKKSSPCILTFGTILNGVAEFKIATKKEEIIAGDFIIKFFDHLIELFPRIMGNVEPVDRAIEKQNSFALEKMHMNSYFILANLLKDKDNWESRLARLTHNNFLSRNNPIWGFSLREGDKIVNSSKVQKRITEIMVEKVMG